LRLSRHIFPDIVWQSVVGFGAEAIRLAKPRARDLGSFERHKPDPLNAITDVSGSHRSDIYDVISGEGKICKLARDRFERKREPQSLPARKGLAHGPKKLRYFARLWSLTATAKMTGTTCGEESVIPRRARWMITNAQRRRCFADAVISNGAVNSREHRSQPSEWVVRCRSLTETWGWVGQ